MNILWQWLEKIFGNGVVVLPLDRNIVYSKPGCEHCARAKEFLAAKNISYEERTIMNSQNSKDLTLLMQQQGISPVAITTPQIWLKGQYIGGATALEEYLTPKE
jgi:glutaredoxin